MSTVVQFAPSVVAAFRFQATFGDAQYNVVVTWSLFGARYYVNVYSVDGTLIVSLPLVGSTTGIQIQGLSWSGGKAVVTTVSNHGYKVGRTVTLTIAGCVPIGYNGLVKAMITGPRTLSYAVASDPGSPTAFGTAGYVVSMTAGYFASTLIYRAPSQQFEISP